MSGCEAASPLVWEPHLFCGWRQVVLQLAQAVFVAAKVLLFSPSELRAAFAAVVAGAVARKTSR